MKQIILLLAIVILTSCSTCHSRRRAQNRKWNVYNENRNPSQYIGLIDNNHKD